MVKWKLALALAFGGGLAGCNWMAFDDLADETWVDRVTKEDAHIKFAALECFAGSRGRACQ